MNALTLTPNTPGTFDTATIVTGSMQLPLLLGGGLTVTAGVSGLVPNTPGILTITANIAGTLDTLYPHVGLYPRTGLFPNSGGITPNL